MTHEQPELMHALPYKPNAKSVSRLMAVQGVYSYQLDDGSETVEALVGRLSEVPMETEAGDEQQAAKPDRKYLRELVQGAIAEREAIDALITPHLKENWRLERLDNLLLAVIRVGIFELKAMQDVETGIILDEYVHIANAFYDTQEAGFVNALLDSLAKELRT